MLLYSRHILLNSSPSLLKDLPTPSSQLFTPLVSQAMLSRLFSYLFKRSCFHSLNEPNFSTCSLNNLIHDCEDDGKNSQEPALFYFFRERVYKGSFGYVQERVIGHNTVPNYHIGRKG